MRAIAWVPRSVRSVLFRSEDYVLLTSSSQHAALFRRRIPCSWRGFMLMLTLRKILITVTLVPVFLLLVIICQGVPSNYNDIRTFERRLPQHSLSVISKNQHQPQYLRFPGHIWGYGFNNVLQEAFVFLLPFASSPSLTCLSDSGS